MILYLCFSVNYNAVRILDNPQKTVFCTPAPSTGPSFATALFRALRERFFCSRTTKKLEESLAVRIFSLNFMEPKTLRR